MVSSILPRNERNALMCICQKCNLIVMPHLEFKIWMLSSKVLMARIGSLVTIFTMISTFLWSSAYYLWIPQSNLPPDWAMKKSPFNVSCVSKYGFCYYELMNSGTNSFSWSFSRHQFSARQKSASLQKITETF